MIDPGDFSPESVAKLAPACGECDKPGCVVIVGGTAIYPHLPHLWEHDDGSKRFWWKCTNCGAYCGVHRGTLKSLGRPAGKETRQAREAAHAAFDPLCAKRQRISNLSKSKARGMGYKWLADQLGISRKECHIGEMDAAMARRVVEVCKGARS